MLLEKYLTIVGVLAARYVIIAGGYYFATWVALKNRVSGFLVNPQSVFRGQIGFELKYALLTTFIFGLGGIEFLHRQRRKPWLRLHRCRQIWLGLFLLFNIS
jgi:hypothetical protein